jgi:hypothetical protein
MEKRINSLQINSPATATVNSFNERIFHELDTINLLSSGKEWFGEEFINAPGKSLKRNFYPLPYNNKSVIEVLNLILVGQQ